MKRANLRLRAAFGGKILPALIAVWAVLWVVETQAQQKCLQPGKAEQLRAQINSSENPTENKELAQEFTKAASDITAATRLATVEKPGEESTKMLRDLERELTLRVCRRLNEQGWPHRAGIGPDGMAAFVFLVSRTMPMAMQLELYPLISDAFAKGDVTGGETLAGYVDRLRLAIGRKQLYGTQAYVREGFLVLAPLEAPETVDERRAKFSMRPLREYERTLEVANRMPLVRSVGDIRGEASQGATPQSSTTPVVASSPLNPRDVEEQAITVDTAFVALDVIVGSNVAEPRTLEKGDFRLFDNGRAVEIETFAKAEAPFDIVLLLDLSGSTADQVGLIKKSTRRFVEMKRPLDRVAVVVFHDNRVVVSELESDKEVLLKRIKDIEGRGASYVWDAVDYALEMLETRSGKERRKAVVLMSDGVDNSLGFTSRLGSRISFADLVERIRRSTASIFPVYLDTEGSSAHNAAAYATARLTLNYMADQSAGNMYAARKLDDVAAIYDRVLKDVGTVYTLGFSPDIEPGSTRWRTLRVEVPSRAGLKIKHRPGYFTR